jgi:hypothetical protein
MAGRSKRCVLASVAAAAVSVWAATAEAQTNVRLEYPDPPPGACPPANVFRMQLLARSHRLRVVGSGESAPRLVVGLTARVGVRGATGQISIKYPDGTEANRSVDGETCESVVEALTLMSAMALDPTMVPAVAKPPTPEPPSSPLETLAPVVQGALDVQPGTHFAAGIGGGLVWAIIPAAVPDVEVFGEILRARPGVWSPSVRAAFDYVTTGDQYFTYGGMATARVSVTADGCPLRWTLGPVRFIPCLHVEGGGLAAQGADVFPVKTSLRPWLAAGVLGAVRFVFGDRFFVELSGGAEVPFIRDRYFLEPGPVTVFQGPYVTPLFGGLLGVTIR